MENNKVSELLLVIIVLKPIEDEEKTRKWIKRREEKCFFNNIVKELRLEDLQGYSEMMRMNYDSFKFVLLKIGKDITPLELAKGGLKPISPAERLILTLRFLATGETYRSLILSIRISVPL